MRHPFSPLRFIERRPRLAIALALGVSVFLAQFELVPDEPFSRQFLVGWNVTVWTYLVLVGWLMALASPERARAISEEEDPSATLVLVLVSLIAVASLGAIVSELIAGKRAADPWAYVLVGVSLFGSWLMLNTLFSFHYAHMYYRAPPATRPLRFPDKPPPTPDYWDFLYVSFTIAVAAQTSDVSVMTPSMRKAVLAQSVLAFVLNVAILGTIVNVVGGLLAN